MQFIIFQHIVIVPKYFQTSAKKPKFIHSKYITDNNGELKKIINITILYFEYNSINPKFFFMHLTNKRDHTEILLYNISKNFNNLSNVKTTLTSLAKSLVSSVGN